MASPSKAYYTIFLVKQKLWLSPKFVVLVGVFDQLVDFCAFVERIVVFEDEFRHLAHFDFRRELVLDETFRVFESVFGFLFSIIVSENRIIGVNEGKLIGHFDSGNRDEAEIHLHVVAENIRQSSLNERFQTIDFSQEDSPAA